MNAVTTVLYMWLNNDDTVYRYISAGEIVSGQELREFVLESFKLESPTVLAEGILGDLWGIADWDQLFDTLVDG